MIYFDNGATTFPKPDSVINKMVEFMKTKAANPGRSGHKMALDAGRTIFEARHEIAQLMNIDNPMNIVFTKNATESINIGIKGYAKKGMHIISTAMEHNSVSRPIVALGAKGVTHTFVKCDENGFLDLDEFEKAFNEKTGLVAITHASNVTGTVNDLKRIGDICRAHKVPLLVDCAQSAGVFDIDVQQMNIAMLCAPGHKGLYGPMGTGFIYVREDISLTPLMEGGTGSNSESLIHPNLMPDHLESGTANAVGIAGLLEGVRFIQEVGIEKIRKHEQELTGHLIQGLKQYKNVKIYGPENPTKRCAVVSFNIDNTQSTDISYILDSEFDIEVRSGLHCAALAHETLGTTAQGVVRVSFSYFNTISEVDEFIKIIGQIINIL